jgi:hypothetical protein
MSSNIDIASRILYTKDIKAPNPAKSRCLEIPLDGIEIQYMTHESLKAQFTEIGISDILDKHVNPVLVARRIRLQDLEALLIRNGWMLERNSQQFIRIVPLRERVAPKLRVVTRSDVAAVYGSRPGRWA